MFKIKIETTLSVLKRHRGQMPEGEMFHGLILESKGFLYKAVMLI
jgi:hypothetical protein